MIRRIALATDFTPEGAPAFRAALALAVEYRARLDILHVSGHGPEWENFPRVRETLEGWGLLPPNSQQEDVASLLGVAIGKVQVRGHDPASGIAEFLGRHRPDLMVAASQGGSGGGWWQESSVAMEAMRRADLPALLFGPAARDLANPSTGALRLATVLMPVAETPAPRPALGKLHALLDPRRIDVRAVHVGRSDEAMEALMPEAVHLAGDVVPAILQEAERSGTDLIAMPTARHKGLLGALRGSTTQKVLRHAPCAVFALPS